MKLALEPASRLPGNEQAPTTTARLRAECCTATGQPPIPAGTMASFDLIKARVLLREMDAGLAERQLPAGPDLDAVRAAFSGLLGALGELLHCLALCSMHGGTFSA